MTAKAVDKTLIFIPTYNERENIMEMANQLLALPFTKDLLFIDDQSPDGTGEILDQLAAKYSNLHVLHRSGKLGIGTAHQAGMRWAYQQGYTRFISMDCDFTHSPVDIERFIAASTSADIVVGSRYMHNSSLSTWNHYRRFLTRLGHFATGLFLGMPYDSTGSFRLYQLDQIDVRFLDLVHAPGYSFFFESLFILHVNGYQIVEVSTNLPARMYGHSKMKLSDIAFSVKQLAKLLIVRTFMPTRLRLKSQVFNTGVGN